MIVGTPFPPVTGPVTVGTATFEAGDGIVVVGGLVLAAVSNTSDDRATATTIRRCKGPKGIGVRPNGYRGSIVIDAPSAEPPMANGRTVVDLDHDEAIEVLNEIVELELAGAVRYTQYSLMVFGHARIPIIDWMRSQADEALLHAVTAGEEVTTLGGKVSLGIGKLVGTHHAAVDEMMEEMLSHERHGIELYRKLLRVSEGADVSLEELARTMVRNEELHCSEIEKMLKKRGDA
jgi:bacterioferritin